MDVKGRAKYEVVVVVVLIALALALGVGLYSKRNKVNNERLLMNELSAMRSAITVYMTVNKAVPASLDTLMKSTYDAGSGVKRTYLDKIVATADGKLIDPFGKPYKYDSKKGVVFSETAGYQQW